jgi:hypothetical protein
MKDSIWKKLRGYELGFRDGQKDSCRVTLEWVKCLLEVHSNSGGGIIDYINKELNDINQTDKENAEVCRNSIKHFEIVIKSQEATIEHQERTIECQGREASRRHELLCEVKEVLDKYFKEDI